MNNTIDFISADRRGLFRTVRVCPRKSAATVKIVRVVLLQIKKVRVSQLQKQKYLHHFYSSCVLFLSMHSNTPTVSTSSSQWKSSNWTTKSWRSIGALYLKQPDK